MTVRNDYTIFISDTISTIEVDSLGIEIQSTLENYVCYKNGRLLTSGKIEMSTEKKQDLQR